MIHSLETVFSHVRRFFFMGDLDKVAHLLNSYEINAHGAPSEQTEGRLSKERASIDSNIS